MIRCRPLLDRIIDGKPPDAKQTLQTDLKAQVVDLVDVGIQERGRRIERLESALKDEKERFARDQNNRDGLVQEQLDRILKDENGDPMRPPASPGEQSMRDGQVRSAECRMQSEIMDEVTFFTVF